MITKYIALFLILFSPLSAHAAFGNSTIEDLIENVTTKFYLQLLTPLRIVRCYVHANFLKQL